MQNIFRSLSFTIVQNVYTLFPELYAIFTKLASARYFTEENIRAMSQNLYIVMCVCMLFALGIRLINAIVNPAMLDGGGDAKNKKSVKHTFINSLLAVLLIVLIPMGFDLLYQVQDNLVEQHWIEKVVLGIDNTDSDQNAGQIIAAYAFYSFCQPNTDKDISVEAFSEAGGDIYNKAITEDINYLKQMDSVINSKTDGEYDLQYNPILAPAVGIYIFYQLILLCMDMALRMFKLGLLELITPIILCGFLFQGSDLLQKWFKEVMKTYVLVYLKIALVAFMVYGLSLLNGFFTRTDADGNKLFEYVRPDGTTSIFFTGIIRTFVIIGLLQLVKQIPDLINSIFGSNIKSRGGISGRLGEMAAVGKLAQKGWDTLRQHPIQTSQRMISAPLSAAGGFISHNAAALRSSIRNGQARAEAIRAQGGRAASFRGFLAGAGQAMAGFATSGGAAIRGAQSGWQNRNLQGIGAQGHRYEDTHVGDSTFGGRMQDTILSSLGLRTRQEQQEQRDKTVIYHDPVTGEPVRRMTFEELQARQNIDKSFDESRSAIRSQIETAIDRSDSHIGMDFTVTAAGRTVNLTGNSASIKQQIEAMSNASAADLGVADAQAKAQLIAELNAQYLHERDAVLNACENEIWAEGTGAQYNGHNILEAGADIAAVRNNLNHATDLIRDNADLANTIHTTVVDDNGVNHTSGITFVDGQVRITDFRAGGRTAVSNEYNQINRDVTRHDEEIAARKTTPEGRERADSHTSVNNAHNNGGNSGSGGSGH